MPAIARANKNIRTKKEWKIWKENACLNLLEWLKEQQEEFGIESEYQFEKSRRLPQNTFNRLRNFSLPSPEKTQKIVENLGIDWGKYGEILNQSRAADLEENQGISQVTQPPETTWQDDILDTLEYLQFHMEKFKNLLKLAQNENFSRSDEEEASMFAIRAMIRACIKQLNLTDEDIKKRLAFLCSVDAELFFSWETFELVRDGSRKLTDEIEATAMSSLIDPHEQVFQLNDWKRAQILDSMNGDLNNGNSHT